MKVLIGNFKGPKGDTGGKGDKGNKGDRGEPGQRGSRWTSGTGITGTSTVGTKFPGSGITDAQLYDYYVNTDTGNLYECKVAGTADVAEWAYIGSFKGPKGDTGPAGSISDINSQKPTYSEASKLENIESGETVKVSFGKLKKAVSVLISHYTQKAAQSILGHVKLSNSAAITTAGEYALDAIEKNAAVTGTLANLIQQANSNLVNKVRILLPSQYLTEGQPINFTPPGDTITILVLANNFDQEHALYIINNEYATVNIIKIFESRESMSYRISVEDNFVKLETDSTSVYIVAALAI